MQVSSHNIIVFIMLLLHLCYFWTFSTDTQHISGTALIPAKALRVQGALLLTSRFCIREPATQPGSTIGTEKNKVVLNVKSD